jgi:hypothetical protein
VLWRGGGGGWNGEIRPERFFHFHLQQDLVKDNGHTYFINYLGLHEERPARSCAQACFVLAIICDSHPRGQLLCYQAGFLRVLVDLLSAPVNCLPAEQKDYINPDTGLLVKWLCLCLGKLVQGMPEVPLYLHSHTALVVFARAWRMMEDEQVQGDLRINEMIEATHSAQPVVHASPQFCQG